MLKITTLIIGVLLSQYQLYANTTYLSRFTTLAKRGAANGFDAAGEQQRLQVLLKRYSWLESLPQPDLDVRTDAAHYQTSNLGIKGLPFEFISDKQLVYTYPDGNKAILAYVAEETYNYEAFLERNKGTDVPTQVLIYKGGAITGRFLHLERPYTYLKNVFGNHDYDFVEFLDEVEDPVINLSSGGYRLGRDIARLTANRVIAFSSDIVGYEGIYYELPYYLFADALNTQLPDDTFGAVIQLGGVLANGRFNYHATKEALAEMVRIVKPDGYILIEISYPSSPETITEAVQHFDKNVEWLESYPALHYNKHSWRTSYLVEIKFNE